jgi:hypothetical protein
VTLSCSSKRSGEKTPVNNGRVNFQDGIHKEAWREVTSMRGSPAFQAAATRSNLMDLSNTIDMLTQNTSSPVRRSPPPMSYPVPPPEPQSTPAPPAGVPSEWWNNVTHWLKECTEEVSSLKRENERREQNEARLAQHHHTLVSQVPSTSMLDSALWSRLERTRNPTCVHRPRPFSTNERGECNPHPQTEREGEGERARGREREEIRSHIRR